MRDKKLFAEWMAHLGTCVGRPVDKTTLTSYWLELSPTVLEEEFVEAVRALVSTWTDDRFPKIAHIRQAVARTRARRARMAIKRIRRLDLHGFDLADERVRAYVAWRIREDVDGETGRAVMACSLPALRSQPEPEAVAQLRHAFEFAILPQLPAQDETPAAVRRLTEGIADMP